MIHTGLRHSEEFDERLRQEREEQIIQSRDNLNSACEELGVIDAKYFPSPDNENASISELANHAAEMLRNYKKYRDGDKSTGIEEIFT